MNINKIWIKQIYCYFAYHKERFLKCKFIIKYPYSNPQNVGIGSMSLNHMVNDLLYYGSIHDLQGFFKFDISILRASHFKLPQFFLIC